MGYPIFGKVKTIVLPTYINSTGAPVSLKEYKDITGIDLSKFVTLDESDKSIHLNFGNSVVYFVNQYFPEGDLIMNREFTGLMPVSKTFSANWVADSHNGILNIGCDNYDGDLVGLSLLIPYNKEFSIDNLLVHSLAY